MTLPPTTAAKDPADAVFAWFRTMLDANPVYLDDNQLCRVGCPARSRVHFA
ncbi:MAG: hypothetical protein ACRDTH_20635 [Pseudonocardiaceae bacterium]